MVGLLESFTVTEILIILLIAIPWIIKGIQWGVNLIKAWRQKKKDIAQEAIQEREEEENIKNRFEKGEARIQNLEKEEN
jgi:hypothetical protein